MLLLLLLYMILASYFNLLKYFVYVYRLGLFNVIWNLQCHAHLVDARFDYAKSNIFTYLLLLLFIPCLNPMKL